MLPTAMTRTGEVKTYASVGGREWSSGDPSLQTWEVQRLADWLEGIADGNYEDNLEYFIEPNISFQLLESPGQKVRLKIVLDCESRAPWLKRSDVEENGHGPLIECTRDHLRQ